MIERIAGSLGRGTILAIAAACLVAVSMLSGCGALIGAGAGAAVGQATGGDTESTVTGAAYGAAVGAAIESEYYRRDSAGRTAVRPR